MSSSITFSNLSTTGFQEPLELSIPTGSIALFVTSGELENRTLMQLITGEQLPETGIIRLLDQQTDQLDREQLLEIRKSVGIVQSSGGLISNLKLWENITLPLLFHNHPAMHAAEENALKQLEQFGLQDKLMSLPAHLSLFERRAAGFVRATTLSPQIMIYCGCFDTLPARQRDQLLEKALERHHGQDALTSVFITSSSTALESLKPDLSCNLRHKAAGIASA
jgi:ABC-type transporter Mla maintaining outer membrane lipid asymmetry ATPase subunit MlaF